MTKDRVTGAVGGFPHGQVRRRGGPAHVESRSSLFTLSLPLYRLRSVTPGQVSVRKGAAGRPAELYRLQVGLSAQA